jgi:hypothetical protein
MNFSFVQILIFESNSETVELMFWLQSFILYRLSQNII